jgi:gliding motility-associated-like protein
MKTVWLSMRRTLLLLLFCTGIRQAATAQIHADFTATPAAGCAPVFVHFNDASTGSPTYWKWDLGNGAISFLQNPSTTYFNPGKYTIKLVIKKANLADSIVKLSYITINALPKPLFKASDTTGCYPLNVHFTDQSQAQEGSIVKWEWDLGDGSVSSLQNPVHSYASPGNYNVILKITNTAGCVSTLSKAQYIKIKDGVKAGFSFINNNVCKPPSIINFTNSSTGTGTLSYQWAFGDGNTSAQINPSNIYNTPGLYSIQLIVNNNIGCTDTLVKKDSIVVGVAKAAFTAPDSICQDAAFQVINNSQPVANNVLWSFGDGSSSTDVNPVKQYAVAGIYPVSLMIDFGSCKDTSTKLIKVLPKPAINFTADNIAACKAPLTVHFTNLTVDGVSYKWWFGDSTYSTQQNPSHTYLQNGTYNLTLIVTNSNGCTDTLKKPGFIIIQPAEIEMLNLPATGCAPVVFSPLYNIKSVIPVTGYSWNFGDGTSSVLPNPSHTYNSAGSYTITLSYTTADGCTLTNTYPNGVKVGQKPAANFTAWPTDACASIPIHFTDNSTGTVTNWLWQFGDGTSDTSRNPSHLYSDTGYFNVRLIASNNGCPDTLLIPKLVHIKPPVAKFAVNFNCANPYRFVFTNYSVGATSWVWDFGDGTTTNAKDPVHIYSTKGSYFVTLTVNNGTCTHAATYLARIVVEKADFIASSINVCKGDSVLLQPVGFNAGNIVYYQWLFGYGTDTARVIKVAYNKSGKYTIRLIITNITGCADTMTKTDYIVVNGPSANFDALKNSACLNTGGGIQFTDSSTTDGVHAIKKWQWDFGDSSIQTFTAPPFNHVYTAAGYYTVRLKTTDTQGCIDSTGKPNLLYIANPKAGFGSPDTMSCQNKPISFTNQSSGAALNYSWSFGDAANSAVQDPIHNYALVGIYDIGLKVIDSYGCRDSVFKPKYIHIDEPKALFTISDSVGTCPPLIVSFTNQSKYYQQMAWDFGDGTGAQMNNPVHYYNYPGTYYARLIVTSPGGCTDTLFKKIEIKGPTGTFIYDKTISCNPGTVVFTAQTENTKSFIWDFNDGSTINTADSTVNHTYTSLGIYLPRMILEDAQGCKVPVLGRDTVRIFGVNSLFNSNKNLLCDAGLVSFTDSSLSNDLIAEYEWRFGDGSTSTDKDPSHTYTTTGIYPVQLIVTTLNGCKDTSRQASNIKVVGSPQVSIRGDSGACAPATLSFFADIVVADTSAFVWQWSFGNNNTSSQQNPGSVTYQQAATYNVTMNASNSSGCVTTRTKPVIIHPVPNLDAGNNTVICEKKTATLQAIGADTYVWSPATALSCTNCAAPVASPDSNIIYRVHGENIFGCKADDSVIIRVKHPFTMLVGNGDTLCKGESFRLSANNAELYDWTPSTGLDNNHGKTVLARPQQTTMYRVVGYDSIGCFYDTGFIKLIVYAFPVVDAGADKTIPVGTSVELNAKVSTDATFIQWQPSVGLSCSNCPNPVANPKQTTAYKVTVMNEGGCINKDELTVFVVCNNGNIFLPNTFSPNGNGTNDVFYPRGTGLYNIRSMRIFNRWGAPVFEASNFQANDASKGWKGDYKNKPAPNDVYVYFVEVICENNAILTYSGNIALIR